MYINIDISKFIVAGRNITGLARNVVPLLENVSEDETREEMIERKTKTFEFIRSHIYHDDSTNVDCLLGTDAQYDYDVLTEAFVNELFTDLKQMYDIIIVDFPTDMCRRQIILGLANMEEIYYICPMEVPAIRSAKILLNVFIQQYGFHKESIKIIINKIMEDNLRAFSCEEVETHFSKEGYSVMGMLPWENTASLSINKGEPLANQLNLATYNLEDGPSNYAEAVYDIAIQINEMLSQPLLEADSSNSKVKNKNGKKSGLGFFSKIFTKKSSKKQIKKPKQDNENPPPASMAHLLKNRNN